MILTYLMAFFSVLNEVDLDVDRFMKDMESVLRQGSEDNAIDMDSEEGSSSDMDFGRLSASHLVNLMILSGSNFRMRLAM